MKERETWEREKIWEREKRWEREVPRVKFKSCEAGDTYGLSQ